MLSAHHSTYSYGCCAVSNIASRCSNVRQSQQPPDIPCRSAVAAQRAKLQELDAQHARRSDLLDADLAARELTLSAALADRQRALSDVTFELEAQQKAHAALTEQARMAEGAREAATHAWEARVVALEAQTAELEGTVDARRAEIRSCEAAQILVQVRPAIALNHDHVLWPFPASLS
jgi:chromosome segregation ATPase